MQFQADLIDQVGIHRARGIVIDVAALDVLDSFASKSLHDLANMARLRGAETVIVGIQPEVAFALVQLPRPLEVPHRTGPRRGPRRPRARHVRAPFRPRDARSARRTQPQPLTQTQATAGEPRMWAAMSSSGRPPLPSTRWCCAAEGVLLAVTPIAAAALSEHRSLGRLEPVRVTGDLPRPNVLSGTLVRLLVNHHGPVIHPLASAANRHSLPTMRHNYLNDVSTKVVQRPGNSAVDGRDDVRHPRRNLVDPTVIRHFRPPSPKGRAAPAQVPRHSNTQPTRAVLAVRRRRVGASQAD